MTQHDTDETRRLMAAATPGEWRAVQGGIDTPTRVMNERGPILAGDLSRGRNITNCELVAHLHNSALAMCDELESLRATVSKLPHTKDGKLCDECEKLFCPKCGSEINRRWCTGTRCRIENRNYSPADCYSTPEAANAARAKP